MGLEKSEAVVWDIRRRTRRKYSSEEKITIVLEGLPGEESISDICRREGIAPNLYYRWSKDSLEAGKKRPGDLKSSASPSTNSDPYPGRIRNFGYLVTFPRPIRTIFTLGAGAQICFESSRFRFK